MKRIYQAGTWEKLIFARLGSNIFSVDTEVLGEGGGGGGGGDDRKLEHICLCLTWLERNFNL